MPYALQSPYRYVNVIALIWEGHNHQNSTGPVFDAGQELSMVVNAFRNYNFHTGVERIPRDKRIRDGFRGRLQRILDDFDGSRTLAIVYYQGHGSLSQRGELVLSNGKGEFMHFSEIANAVISARVDVLTMLNCCHAGAALNTNWQVRNAINYEAHIKDIIMAVPANRRTTWGCAQGFAAALEQALRENHKTWPQGFRGTPQHWARAISRIMHNEVGVRHLVATPRNRVERPIVIAKRN